MTMRFMTKRGGSLSWLTFAVLFFGATGKALPQDNPPNTSNIEIRNITVSDFFIPSELGYIVDNHEPQKSTKLVIHIQDIHGDYQAQRNLASILEALIDEHNLKLILVEGGHGNLSLAYMRKYGPQQSRRQIAGDYLKTGIISGEEYVDITSNAPLILWGIEDPDLYQENLDVYFALQEKQKSIAPIVQALSQKAESLKPHIYSSELLDLEAKREDFANGRITLSAYAPWLMERAESHALPTESFPEARRLVAIQKLESLLDLQAVHLEQRELFSELKGRMNEAAFEALIGKGRLVQSGEASREGFYNEVVQAAQSVGVDPQHYTRMSQYTDYLAQREALLLEDLMGELKSVELMLASTLAREPESQRLMAIVDGLQLVNKLVHQKLSSTDYGILLSSDLLSELHAWEAFLQAHAAVSKEPVPNVVELVEAVPEFFRFYEIAKERDLALVERSIAKLEETDESIAVLITGGFHTAGIADNLKQRQIARVSVVPATDGRLDDRLYKAVLNFKSGRGSLDEVERIANAQQVASINTHHLKKE